MAQGCCAVAKGVGPALLGVHAGPLGRWKRRGRGDDSAAAGAFAGHPSEREQDPRGPAG